ncbi:MAG TPA: hypothetical protein VFU02_16040 [Polyangiaceae bacterium]|nr:hypothetical protein [Polyangiaceae bacterium]
MKREFETARKKEEELRRSLEGAKDEAERARIEAKLAAAAKEKEAAGKAYTGGGGVRPKPAAKSGGAPCNCPPGDPLCSCL